MKRFVEGEDRRQGVLLPEFLDDYVSEENPVRVVDVFVEELDLGARARAKRYPCDSGDSSSARPDQALGAVHFHKLDWRLASPVHALMDRGGKMRRGVTQITSTAVAPRYE